MIHVSSATFEVLYAMKDYMREHGSAQIDATGSFVASLRAALTMERKANPEWFMVKLEVAKLPPEQVREGRVGERGGKGVLQFAITMLPQEGKSTGSVAAAMRTANVLQQGGGTSTALPSMSAEAQDALADEWKARQIWDGTVPYDWALAEANDAEDARKLREYIARNEEKWRLEQDFRALEEKRAKRAKTDPGAKIAAKSFFGFGGGEK